MDLQYSVKIYEDFSGSNSGKDFVISGTAISASSVKPTDNNHMFLPEELRKSVHTLVNRPLLKDHSDKIDDIIGKVIKAEFNEAEQAIKFKAKVNNSENGLKIQKLIRDGFCDSVSIGAYIKQLEEGDGYLIPRGIKFKELSCVSVPADDNAKFHMGEGFEFALKEAWQKLPAKNKMNLFTLKKTITEKLNLHDRQINEARQRLNELKNIYALEIGNMQLKQYGKKMTYDSFSRQLILEDLN